MLVGKIMCGAVAALVVGATATAAPAGATQSEPPAAPVPIVVSVVGAGPDAAPATSAGVRALTLGRSPHRRITVVTANVAEYLSVPDNRHSRDLRNFARRLHEVLLAERNRGEPVYTPDLILLQEVNRTTAHRVRMLVSHSLGQNYAVAGGSRSQPARGRGAILRTRSRHHALLTRATAVLYNTATMRRPSAIRKITFSYPKAQRYRPRQCPHTTRACQPDVWESRQSSIFRIVARDTGRAYAVASVHFVPYKFLRPRLNRHQVRGFRQALWLRSVRIAMNRHFPHARQIIGGDFNDHLCVDSVWHLGQPGCSRWRQFTPLYREALKHRNLHPAVRYGIDNVFTPGPIVTSGKDATYKLAARRTTAGGRTKWPSQARYLTERDFHRRFATTASFDRCNAAFIRGDGGSRLARRIAGCTLRYYSDHPFDWAVIR